MKKEKTVVFVNQIIVKSSHSNSGVGSKGFTPEENSETSSMLKEDRLNRHLDAETTPLNSPTVHPIMPVILNKHAGRASIQGGHFFTSNLRTFPGLFQDFSKFFQDFPRRVYSVFQKQIDLL